MSRRLIAVWKAVAWKGEEQCFIELKDGLYTVNSKIKGSVDSTPFDIHYELKINNKWQIISAIIRTNPVSTILVNIQSDTKGNWSGSGKALPQFTGCIDIDISLSPLTNTLPIRRLNFVSSTPQAINVIYIDLPTGQLKIMKQWYTKLCQHLYRYEDENNYTNTITVDQDGLVINYPELFQRIEI